MIKEMYPNCYPSKSVGEYRRG